MGGQEEEEEEEGLFRADAVNEEDPERDQEEEGLFIFMDTVEAEPGSGVGPQAG